MADIDKIKDTFQKALDTFKGEIAAEDVEKVHANMDEITKVIATVVDVFGDGLQLGDVSRIGEIIAPVMKLASSFKDYAGEDKKRFVVEVVWLVYRAVDTYPDGNHNNINIPFVMGGIERKLERGIIAFAASMAVDAVYKKLKDADEV